MSQSIREAAAYFGVAAENLPPVPAVSVQYAGRVVRIPHDDFQPIFVGAFWAGAGLYPNFPGTLNADGIRMLAAEAQRRGQTDYAEKLDALRAGMTGLAVLRTEDGQPWKPVKTVGPVRTVGPSEAKAAEVIRATAEEIAEFFESGDFRGAQGKRGGQ